MEDLINGLVMWGIIIWYYRPEYGKLGEVKMKWGLILCVRDSISLKGFSGN